MSVLTRSHHGLEPYDKRRPHRGAQLVAALRAALGPLAPRLEHVGGTAVPNLAATPVFDVQASVPDLAGGTEAFDGPLAALGLRRRPDATDHIPAGRRDDPRRWAKRCWAGTIAIRDAARPGDALRTERVRLHVRVAGAPNERLALLLRDWFRAHPETVPAHGGFALKLAEALASLDGGAEVTDPLVDLVVVTAEAWADRTGWRA
ncbi:GrpB family protein [Virgisporangium ochraceum]|uniref:Uncharacterized protein n=1 Tax=Virgisporangium ochraceum TaxID=65505 RepID=A0A8J3ZZ72_9ACTN|nr:GrpB family protein [Virgisporangium ochraceum]GIJ71973.1 hypothetical protein Voc01_068900 [Virgisporangium ochraceum]